MAHQRFRLPPLKLTKRSTLGSKSVEIIHRGLEETYEEVDLDLPSRSCTVAHSQETGTHYGLRSETVPMDFSANQIEELEEPTDHELKCKSTVAGWEEIRMKILQAVTEAEAVPCNEACHNCGNSSATIRCQQCGPFAFYCLICFRECHSKVNIFHVGEKLEVHVYYLILCEYSFLMYRMVIMYLCLMIV